jgi:hypothetical protein
MVRSTATNDSQLMGAEISFGPILIGQVEGLAYDPISQRVRRLITSYGLNRRRVGGADRMGCQAFCRAIGPRRRRTFAG